MNYKIIKTLNKIMIKIEESCMVLIHIMIMKKININNLIMVKKDHGR